VLGDPLTKTAWNTHAAALLGALKAEDATILSLAYTAIDTFPGMAAQAARVPWDLLPASERSRLSANATGHIVSIKQGLEVAHRIAWPRGPKPEGLDDVLAAKHGP
jgi:hypothetical protein